MRRAVMGLPRWKRTGGRDFVFYHSHPGFEWDDLDVTTAYQETVCNDFQVTLPCRDLSRYSYMSKHVLPEVRHSRSTLAMLNTAEGYVTLGCPITRHCGCSN